MFTKVTSLPDAKAIKVKLMVSQVVPMQRKTNQIRVKTRKLTRPSPRDISFLMLLSMAIWLLVNASSAQAATGKPQTIASSPMLERVGLAQISAEQAFKQGYLAFRKGYYHRAMRYWLPIAEQGHPESQYYMGVLHEEGNLDFKDVAKAFSWYRLAALAGHSGAQHNLAVAYVRGEGIGKDIKRAINWWLKAAHQGNADSQYNLGIIYAMGADGVAQDMVKAERWWLKAAQRGDALAQYNLGALYATGDSGHQNYCEAARWWKRSVQNGLAQAHDALRNLQGAIRSNNCR